MAPAKGHSLARLAKAVSLWLLRPRKLRQRPALMLLSAAPPPGGRRIQDGDLVVVYESYDSMRAHYVEARKGQLSNKHGHFPHKDWVGKVRCPCRAGFLTQGALWCALVDTRVVSRRLAPRYTPRTAGASSTCWLQPRSSGRRC